MNPRKRGADEPSGAGRLAPTRVVVRRPAVLRRQHDVAKPLRALARIGDSCVCVEHSVHPIRLLSDCLRLTLKIKYLDVELLGVKNIAKIS